MHQRIESCVVILTVLTLLMAVGGCGSDRPERVPVAGKVMIDGEPVEHGSIRLIPPDARPSVGKLGPGGQFELTCFGGDDGSVLGTHKVTVTAVEQLDPNTQRWHAPKLYSTPSTSPLEVEIDGPTKDLVIELSWNGGKPFAESLQEAAP
jgi:hypothetical protein